MRLRNIVGLLFAMIFVALSYFGAAMAFEAASWIWTPVWVLVAVLSLFGFMVSFYVALDD